MYTAMALQDELYRDALIRELPKEYEEFSFYGKTLKSAH